MEIAEDKDLLELIERPADFEGRIRLGMEVLGRLLNEGLLYAVTPAGWTKIDQFKAELFMQVFNALEFLTTQAGKKIFISKTWKLWKGPPPHSRQALNLGAWNRAEEVISTGSS